MFQDKIFSYNSGMRGNLHTHKTLKTLESGQIQNRLEKKIWEDLDTNKPGSGLNLKMLMPENWNFSTENRGSCHSSHQEEYIDILLALISQYCAWLASGTLIFESGSYNPPNAPQVLYRVSLTIVDLKWNWKIRCQVTVISCYGVHQSIECTTHFLHGQYLLYRN